MTTSYRVVIRGVDLEHSVGNVAAALAPKFKTTKERMISILQAPQFIVKKGIDLASAARFEGVLKKAGCVCVVEPDDESQVQTSPAPIPQVAQQTAGTRAPQEANSAELAGQPEQDDHPVAQANNPYSFAAQWRAAPMWQRVVATFFFVFGAIGLLTMIPWNLGGSQEMDVADHLLSQRLRAPSSYNAIDRQVILKYPYSAGIGYVVKVDYDAQNGFGATVRDCKYVIFKIQGDKYAWNRTQSFQDCLTPDMQALGYTESTWQAAILKVSKEQIFSNLAK